MKRALSLGLVAALAACGGGAGVVSGTHPMPTPNTGSTSVSIKLIVPGAAASAAAHLRKPLYTSRDTQGMGIDFKTAPQPMSSTPNRNPAIAVAIAAGQSPCAGAEVDGSFTCTINIASVPVGYNNFRVTLWNAPPSSGSFASAKVLSSGVALNQATLAGQANTIGFTLLPVVDSITLALSPATVPVSVAATPTLYVTAKDAAGDIITGADPFVDSSGNLLTINVASSDTTHAPLSASAFANATTMSATVNYDGYAEASPVTFTATPTSAINGSNFGTSLAFTTSGGGVGVPGDPAVTLVPGVSNNSNPAAMVNGTDGNLYLSETVTENIDQLCVSANGCTAGTISQFRAYVEQGIAADHNGNIWFGNFLSNQIQVFSPSVGGISASYNTPSGNGAVSLALGPDGNMWYTANNGEIGRSTPNGVMSEYGVADSNGTRAVCSGPDGNVWFSANNGSAYKISPATGAISEYTGVLEEGLAPGFNLLGTCVAGPDGNVWWAMGGRHVTRITPSGSATLFDSGGYAESITVGPDGNLWIPVCLSDFTCPSGEIVRMQTNGSKTAFTAGVPGALQAIGTGSDRNIYFATTGALYSLTP